MPTLLVVDDEPMVLEFLRSAFHSPDIVVLSAGTGSAGLEAATQHLPDVALLDLNLPDMSGLELLQKLHEFDARIPTIVMTGDGTAETAIKAMTLGAFDYLLKPLEAMPLQNLVNRAFEASRLMHVPALLDKRTSGRNEPDLLLGQCPAMQTVYKQIGRVAPQNVMVLIRGESGTGKELVARAIYHYSPRSTGPFLAINCAAIPEALLESELFGHEKGAFTGADRLRIGKFEQCNGGTILLDEIGDMTPATQAKILRLLQEQEFERVGGRETIHTDVRLIAATNRDLQTMMLDGQFRSDLYYRLNVSSIDLPPLRERGDDLILLADHFIRRYSREFNKRVAGIAEETLVLFQSCDWPGNVRELQSVLKHGLLQTVGPVLLPHHLPRSFQNEIGKIVSETPVSVVSATSIERFINERLNASSTNLYAEWLGSAEKDLLAIVLKNTGGNLSQAAKILGLHRTTLRNKMNALKLELDVTDREPGE